MVRHCTLTQTGCCGNTIAGKRLQRERVEPCGRDVVCRAEFTVEPRERERAGIPRHAVGSPARMDELIPASGEPAHHRDTGGSAAFGDARRVDRRAAGCGSCRAMRSRPTRAAGDGSNPGSATPLISGGETAKDFSDFAPTQGYAQARIATWKLEHGGTEMVRHVLAPLRR